MKSQSVADGFVQGTITDGTFSASVTAYISCTSSGPVGSITGTFSNVFTGGPELSNFTYSSSSPLIVGALDAPDFVDAIFANVTLNNTTTNQTYTGCTAVLTAQRLSDNSWTGSTAVICPEGPTLTAFGGFTGTASAERNVLCQVLL